MMLVSCGFESGPGTPYMPSERNKRRGWGWGRGGEERGKKEKREKLILPIKLIPGQCRQISGIIDTNHPISDMEINYVSVYFKLSLQVPGLIHYSRSVTKKNICKNKGL